MSDTIRIHGMGRTCLHVARGIGFFRVFGWGLHWKDIRRHRLLWSERNRFYYSVQFGSYLLTPLKRGDRGFRRKV